jgi:hypothetical protein
MLYLWDWGQECPASSLVTSEVEMDVPIIARSSWRRELAAPIRKEQELLPSILDASIRFVLPALDGRVVGLSISTGEVEDGFNPLEVTLANDWCGARHQLKSYTCQRGVALSSRSGYLHQYSWPHGNSVQRLSVASLFSNLPNAWLVYLNDALNCVHIFNFENLMYMTIRL